VDETDKEYFDSDYRCGADEPNCRSGEATVPLPEFKHDDIFVSEHFTGLDGDATRTRVSSHVPLRGWATLVGGTGGGGGGGPLLPPPPGQNLPPTVSAGPDVSGEEGTALTLFGSASDPESTPAITWTYSAGPDVDPGASCSFGSAHEPTTTISCTDDGTFYATITARDGVNEPVSDTARVRLSNAPPTLSLTGPAPWSVFRAGTPVKLTAAVADPGANDTHTCAVAWDDGTTDSYPATSQTCDRGHTFTHAGMYTIKVTVTDDDDGSATAEVMVVVYDPDGGFVTAGGHLDSPPGALTDDPEAAGKAHFQFSAKYHKDDEGPEPSGGKVDFRLQGADFRLDSTSLEWLVVTPDGKVAVKGSVKVHS
jgi:PKD domain